MQEAQWLNIIITMKTKYLFTLIIVASFAFTSCKKEAPKKVVKKEVIAANYQTASIHISGMTCKIGCAKSIQSKLNKKNGITDAKVIFTDSTATVKYDTNKTSINDIVSFINNIAGGDIYKATETK